MPNGIAYLTLLLWPLLAIALFRRLPVAQAVIWTILGAYLVLPPVANFNLPLVPPLDKTSIPAVCALGIVLATHPHWRNLLPENVLARLFLAVFVLGAVPTVWTNLDPTIFSRYTHAEPITFADWSLPGLSHRDVISVLTMQVIVVIPFLLARRFLATEEAMRHLCRALVAGALAYSLPMLIEIRFSPQINIWVYGFFQHEFLQTMRGGGFRPLVFLPHPLWLALLILLCTMAALALARSSEGRGLNGRMLLAGAWLFVLLYLCKSLASFTYGVVLLPLILLAPPRLLVQVAMGCAVLATTYPLLRGADMIPVDLLLDWANGIDPARAHSLEYRFGNEALLLERAAERPWFGWGGWGRNLVHDVYSHEILTIPDGHWIITFGTYGWLGYVAEFGLLSLPIVLIWRESLRPGSEITMLTAVLCLMLGINLVDMLVNATLTPVTWLVVGALLGRAEAMRAARRATDGTERRLGTVMGAVPEPEGPRTVM